jgi:hypothetical protein
MSKFLTVYYLCMLLAFDLFAQLPDRKIRDLKVDVWQTTATIFYRLPFEGGKNIFLYKVGKASICAKTSKSLDFKMKPEQRYLQREKV